MHPITISCCQKTLVAKVNTSLLGYSRGTLQRPEELIKQRKKFGIQINFATANSVPLGKTLSCSLVKWNLNFKDE